MVFSVFSHFHRNIVDFNGQCLYSWNTMQHEVNEVSVPEMPVQMAHLKLCDSGLMVYKNMSKNFVFECVYVKHFFSRSYGRRPDLTALSMFLFQPPSSLLGSVVLYHL